LDNKALAAEHEGGSDKILGAGTTFGVPDVEVVGSRCRSWAIPTDARRALKEEEVLEGGGEHGLLNHGWSNVGVRRREVSWTINVITGSAGHLEVAGRLRKTDVREGSAFNRLDEVGSGPAPDQFKVRDVGHSAGCEGQAVICLVGREDNQGGVASNKVAVDVADNVACVDAVL